MRVYYKDRNVRMSVFLAVILLVLHSWQFFKSGYQIQPLVNLLMVAVYVPVVLLYGLNCLPFYLLVYSFVWIPFESFDNYTSLFLLCSAISLNKKFAVCFIPYCIETLVCYMLNGLQISHISITSCYILFFWVIYVTIQNKHADFQILELTEDEERILIELAKGKLQKEIDFYSHVTVCKKLKEARERNNCISTDELVTKYKSTNQLN